jgi:glycosyltransferase involved in cell wall biosynthesis
MGNRPLKVLAVVDGLIPSVELVLAKPFRWLMERGQLEYSLVVISDLEADAAIEQYDLLIIMRACMPDSLALAQLAKSRGVPFIYAIDDDFEALDPETPLGRHYREARAWPRLLQMCSMADQVWAFSQPLRQKLLAVQSRVVVPPAIASIEAIGEIRSAADASGVPPSKGRVIGYGASRYHAPDVDAIAPALLDILAGDPDVSIELIGVAPQSLLGHERVRHFDFLPTIEDFYRFVAGRGWTVGIAPLLRNAANDAKTDNKFREYASLGIPAVYSDAPAYWHSVIDGYNGLVARDLAEWRRHVKALLDRPAVARRIAEQAWADAYRRYSLETVCSRYLDLMNAAVSPPVRVLVNAANIPTTDIDLVRPLGRLAREGAVEWKLLPHGEQANEQDLAWAQVVVISRLHDEKALGLLRTARADFGLPVVYAWDDDFFNIPMSLGDLARYHRSERNVRSLEALLSEADLVKASSSRVAEQSRRYSENVVQLPYGFDFEQLDAPPATPTDGDPITIGFFGTVGHSASVDAVVGALQQVAAVCPDVRFEFFGPRSPLLESLPRTTFIPFEPSAEASLRLLAARGWSIGLGPLEVNDFNRAKLPTKYRDYSACHIAGVYTRIDPYESVVDEGRTGLLVDNDPDAWAEALIRLVSDSSLRHEIASRAHAHVRGELSVDQTTEHWRQLLRQLVPAEDAVSNERMMQRIRLLEDRLAATADCEAQARNAALRLLGAVHYQVEIPPGVRGFVARGLRYLLRRLCGARHVLTPLPPGPEVLELADAQSADGGGLLGLTPNLQGLPFVELPLKPVGVPVQRLRVPFATVVPRHDGVVGIELVSPDDRIAYHGVMAIERLPASMIGVFDLDSVDVSEPGWRLRVFTRDAVAPVHAYLIGVPNGAPRALFGYEAAVG